MITVVFIYVMMKDEKDLFISRNDRNVFYCQGMMMQNFWDVYYYYSGVCGIVVLEN